MNGVIHRSLWILILIDGSQWLEMRLYTTPISCNVEVHIKFESTEYVRNDALVYNVAFMETFCVSTRASTELSCRVSDFLPIVVWEASNLSRRSAVLNNCVFSDSYDLFLNVSDGGEGDCELGIVRALAEAEVLIGKGIMALSVASQNLRESVLLPQLPKGFQRLSLSERRSVSVWSVGGSAVRGRTDSKRRFYDSVERNYARKGSYFRRKDEVSMERVQERGIGGNVNRDNPQMKSSGYFRIFGVEVLLERDLGKDSFEVSDAVLESTAAALRCQASFLKL